MNVFRSILCFASILLTVSCTMPPRPSYDRDSASYRFSASEKTAEKMLQTATGDVSEWMAIVKPWLGTPYKYGKASKSGTDWSG